VNDHIQDTPPVNVHPLAKATGMQAYTSLGYAHSRDTPMMCPLNRRQQCWTSCYQERLKTWQHFYKAVL